MLILGHKGGILGKRLRDKKMIKRVAVVQRQFGELLQMCWLNPQKIEGFSLECADNLRDVSLQFSDSDLDHDFPE